MSVTQVPGRMGALWQQRMSALKEYEVVRDGNVFTSGFSNSFVFTSDYDRARRYLYRLIEQYEGIPFSHVFSGNDLANGGGVCFHLRSDFDIPHLKFDNERFRHDILSDLTLTRGIGSRKTATAERPRLQNTRRSDASSQIRDRRDPGYRMPLTGFLSRNDGIYRFPSPEIPSSCLGHSRVS